MAFINQKSTEMITTNLGLAHAWIKDPQGRVMVR